MDKAEAPTFRIRIGEMLIAQLSSRLLLNLIFIATWVWGFFWIVNVGQSDSSVFFAILPAMLVGIGTWLFFLNRGFGHK